jgi:hypothetical protein
MPGCGCRRKNHIKLPRRLRQVSCNRAVDRDRLNALPVFTAFGCLAAKKNFHANRLRQQRLSITYYGCVVCRLPSFDRMQCAIRATCSTRRLRSDFDATLAKHSFKKPLFHGKFLVVGKIYHRHKRFHPYSSLELNF